MSEILTIVKVGYLNQLEDLTVFQSINSPHYFSSIKLHKHVYYTAKVLSYLFDIFEFRSIMYIPLVVSLWMIDIACFDHIHSVRMP